ncbi:MAG: CPBP family intramembrane glutamic endopeptidase [Thermoplasmata archaeon]
MSMLTRAMKFVVLLFVAGFYLMLISANYLGLLYSLYIVPRNILLLNPSLDFGLFVPYYIHLFTLSGDFVLAYYFFMVFLLFFGLIFLVWLNWNGCLKEIRERRHVLTASHNPLLIISEVFCVIVFITIVYNLLLSAGNVTPETPEFETEPIWENMLLLANASIYEEFAVRVVLLALPLFAAQFIVSRKVNFKAFFTGGQKLDWISGILVFISSLIFGLAHALYGWDIYKVLPAFVAGLGFGYVYLKGGIFAPILMHFAFDYMDITYMLAVKEILTPAAELLAMPGIFVEVVILMFAIAVAPIILFAYLKKFFEKMNLVSSPRASEDTRRQVEGGLVSLQFSVGTCPRCGATDAKYIDGNTLECLRCGEKRKMG